jgi:hypothetical protein
MIDSEEASSALAEIKTIARKVRQSTIYQLSSVNLIMWGVLVFAGYVAIYFAPRTALWTWIGVAVVGSAGWLVIAAMQRRRAKVQTFNLRVLAAVLLFLAFGFFVVLLGHFRPHQIAAFWTIYFMLVYTIVGLWTGTAFVVIGLTVTALTLIGYFFVGEAFNLWMAAVNGGGLFLGGLWMRRE